MDIKATLFFVFWAIISLTFLKLGFNDLDRTDLSDAVSPGKIQDDRYYVWLLFLLVIQSTVGGPIVLYQYIYYCGYAVEVAYRPVLVKKIGDVFVLGVDCVLKLRMMGFSSNMKFIPLLALLIGAYTSAVRAAMLGEERLYGEMLPIVSDENENMRMRKKRRKFVRFGVGVMATILRRNESKSYWRRILKERRKFIEFAVGMVGTIFFQNFFRLTSFDHVLAFLYLAVSWLGNLALLRASSDFGVFNFLLGNVIVGCTVSQFGLEIGCSLCPW